MIGCQFVSRGTLCGSSVQSPVVDTLGDVSLLRGGSPRSAIVSVEYICNRVLLNSCRQDPVVATARKLLPTAHFLH